MQSLVVEDDQKIEECTLSIKKGVRLMVGSAITAIQYTLAMITVYLVLLVQRNCVKLMWIKGQMFFCPRWTLMLNILKAIKGIIQYSSTNEV